MVNYAEALATLESEPVSCAICGGLITMPWGAVLFNLMQVPQPALGAAQDYIRDMEKAPLCWSCMLKTLQLLRILFDCQGSLAALAAVVQELFADKPI